MTHLTDMSGHILIYGTIVHNDRVVRENRDMNVLSSAGIADCRKPTLTQSLLT